MGRHAARRGTALSTILTNNPKFDALLREGYEEVQAERAKPRPAKAGATDLFGNPLKGKRR
jgi:hypothetical protein